MQVIRNPKNKITNQKNAVAIGSFDGVHFAHRKLIEKINDDNNLVKVAFAIEKLGVQTIMTQEHKQMVLGQLGVDIVVEQQFTKEFAELTPNEFFNKYIVGILNASIIVVGFNFKFGNNRSGDVEFLQKLCNDNNIECYILPPVLYKNKVVSSTEIREHIKKGKLDLARELLTEPFSIRGQVMRGSGLGRKIGFPTANIQFSETQILPPFGVYSSFSRLPNGDLLPSITHFGKKPTVDDSNNVTCETYILDFDSHFYGEVITILLDYKIRDIKKFESVEKLQKQINLDIEKVCTKNKCKKMVKSN